MTWTIEERLLLDCCQSNIQGKASRYPADILCEIEWDTFLVKVRKEGVSSLVHLQLPCVVDDINEVPQQVVEELRSDYYAIAARNAVLFRELGDILGRLSGAGIEVIVLKGAALADVVYGNLAMRFMSDVDLLIKKQDLSALDFLMNKLGYSSPDIKTVDPTALPADYLTSVVYMTSSKHSPCFHVHWHFVNSTIPNESLIRNIDLTTVWRDAIKEKIAGVETMVMAPHHFLIHLAEHSLRVTHSLTKMSLLCDINELIVFYGEKVNWERLVEECRQYDLGRMIYFPLFFAVKFLHAPVPQEVLLELRPAKWNFFESIFKKLISENCRYPGLSYLLHLSRNKTITARIRFIFKTIFPPRQVIAQRCAIPLEQIGFVFYLRRVGEVFFAIGRMALKLCRRGVQFSGKK